MEKELLGPALDRPIGKVLPVRGVGTRDRNTSPLSMVVCYGWRGTDPRVQYLSQWEFLMGWRPVRLEHPHLYYPGSTRLTNWTEKGMKKMSEASDDEKPWYEPSVDFVIVEEFPSVHAVARRELSCIL